MMRVKQHQVVLGLLLGLFCLVAGCSDDNDPVGPGGGGGGDTTAPLVVGVEPGDLASGVAVDALITITFNEDMDPTSHDGQITLSSGTITDLAWTTARVLTVAHDGWDEGATVTLTVGTGLSDVAGNQLATPFAATFYTESSELLFLTSSPEDGATDVNRSTRINLLFSAPMNEGSVASHLSLQDADLNDLPHTLDSIGDGWLQVAPEAALPASTVITLTIAAGAQDQGGRALADPVSISFTTGDEVDTTPPTITSIVPASGSTIPTSTSTIVMTFSEPMLPESFQPREMGAEFMMLIAMLDNEPVWSQNHTVLTIALPTPLPAGLPLWADFADYSDANGVVQPAVTEWSVTVSGTADYYPVVDGQELEYWVEWQDGEIGNDDPLDSGSHLEYIRLDVQSGDLFHRAFYEDGTYQQTNDGEIMRRTATALEMHGFYETNEGTVETLMFSQPLTFLQFPASVGADWGETATLVGAPNIEITTSGTWVERLDRMPLSFSKDQMLLAWTDVWVATLSYTMSEDGTPMHSGTDTMYLAPGIGVVKIGQDETDHLNGEWSLSESVLLPPGMR